MKAELPPLGEAMQNKVKLALLDDHAMIRQTMRFTFEKMGFEWVADSDNGEDFIERCKEEKPDVIVTDLKLPGQSVPDIIRRLVSELPDTKVLVYSAAEYQRPFEEAMEAGAHGYIHKGSSVNLLQSAIETVHSGGKFLGSVPHPESDIGSALSPREVDVLRLIAQGQSTKQLASDLGISVRTADHYRTRVMQKLKIHDAVSLTRYALKAGIVSLD